MQGEADKQQPPSPSPATPPPPAAPGGGQRAAAAAVVLVVLVIAVWEATSGLWRRSHTPGHGDWVAAAAAVRADFRPGDLIAIAPPWADPLGRAELGDLMPPAMVGRADGRRYRRIWELSLASRSARAEDTTGLTAEWTGTFGGVQVSRYSQRPVTVTFDLVEHALEARVAQRALPLPATPVEPTPCLWQGPLPSPQAPPAPGPAGAFRCPGSKVERRMLEINYRPRYGVAVELEAGRQTQITWDIPEGDLRGGQLVLWFGLHDYYARKNAQGPADVTVDVDDGQVRLPLRLELGRGLQQLVVAPPPATAPGRALHAVRIEVSAASAPNHVVGVLGQVEKAEQVGPSDPAR